jgi:uncharacterized protein YciI
MQKPINEKPPNLFVVLLKYIVPLDLIDTHRPAHLHFLDDYYSKGIFLISGRQTSKAGGVILAKHSNQELLREILKQDPFAIHNLATYEIYEFSPTKYIDAFKNLFSIQP